MASLSSSEWIGSELSKGFAVAMRALDTNQAARAVLQRKLKEERDAMIDLKKQLDQSNRQVRAALLFNLMKLMCNVPMWLLGMRGRGRRGRLQGFVA